MSGEGIQIYHVQANSLAERHGLHSGDCLLEVNRVCPRDILEYKEAILSPRVELKYKTRTGEVQEIVLEKDLYEELGLTFFSSLFDGIYRCKNNCAFCFVHQLPQGLRPSLYVKDDDYRLSFLEGSFVTLSNLKEADFQRIIQSRLSPLYISVHTFNPELRRELMGNPKTAQIKEDLFRLAEAGIQFHLQLVLIPGVNDGDELDYSLRTTERFGDACLSLGVVPVGLTHHRNSLPQLSRYSSGQARQVLEIVHSWQYRFYTTQGRRKIYAADEFYLLAEGLIPEAFEYEGYPQLENGIGLTRLFWENFTLNLGRPRAARPYIIVTGVSGSKPLQAVLLQLPKTVQAQIKLLVVENSLFGPPVTVTGLLSAQDIVNAIKRWERLDNSGEWEVLIPDIIFNDQGLTLDDWSLDDINNEVGHPVRVVEHSGIELAKLLSKTKVKYSRCIHE